jgi:hypothetical protein
MRYKLLIFILAVILLVTNVSASITWCYQETANVSTSCGGLDTGYYYDSTSVLGHDGDWATHPGDMQTFSVVYHKPLTALSTSLWQTSATGTLVNSTIPQQCWDYNTTSLYFKVISNSSSATNDSEWLCYNGTKYLTVYGVKDSYGTYEEAMWWAVGSSMSALCYQETANISSGCGDLSTGKYSYSNVSNLVYVNYSTPPTTLTTSKWMVKYANGTLGGSTKVQNFTLPSVCWNTTELQFKLTSNGGGYPNNGVILSCFNYTSSKWIILDSVVAESGTGDYSSGTVSSNLVFDGDWDTFQNWHTGNSKWTQQPSTTDKIYEEAMWWNFNNTPIYILDYKPSVNEQEWQDNYLIILINNTDPSMYNPSFVYNNTYKETTRTENSTHLKFNSSFFTPITNATVTINAYWLVNWTDFYGVDYTDNISFNQTIRKIELGNCSDNNYTAIQVKIFSENEPTQPLNATLESEIVYYSSSPDYKFTYSTIFLGNDTYSMCFFNSSTSIYANIYFKYYNNGVYNRYYEFNTLINGSVQKNVTLYLLNSTSGESDMRMTTRQASDYKYYPNAFVKLQRYYVYESLWRTVQMGLSDDYGLTVFNIKERDNDYKFIFSDTNNNILATTTSLKFACTNYICSLTYLLDPSLSLAQADFLSYLVTFDNNTNMFYLNWTIPSGNSHTITLRLRQFKSTGTIYICNTSQYGAGGYISCNASNYGGDVMLDLIMNSNKMVMNGKIYSLFALKLYKFIGNKEGAVWVWGITMTGFMFGITGGAIGAIASLILGVIFSYLLGIFSPLTIIGVVLVIILGLVIGYKVKQ